VPISFTNCKNSLARAYFGDKVDLQRVPLAREPAEVASVLREMLSFPRSVPCCSAMVVAAVVLAVAPTELPADQASMAGNANFSEADSVQLIYVVNLDGSVNLDPTNPFNYLPAAGSWTIPSQCSQIVLNCGVTFPALPPGDVITSGTLDWEIAGGLNFLGNNPGSAVSFSGGITPPFSVSVSGGGCSGQEVSQTPSGSFSFGPCSSTATFWSVGFSGNDDLAAQLASVDFADPPGVYAAGANLGVGGGYTLTINFSSVPEPATYGPVAALGLLIAFASRRRMLHRPKA
jgi:hypothetical protein